MSGTYEEHRARQEADYPEAYRKWVESLTPADRAAAKKLGVDVPDLGPASHPGDSDGEEEGRDPADWFSASYTPEMAAQLDTMPDLLMERFLLTQHQARCITRWHLQALAAEVEKQLAFRTHLIVGYLIAAGNVPVRAVALTYHFNLDAIFGLESSMRAEARKRMLSHHTLCKEVKHLQNDFGTPSGRHGKTEAARGAYQQVQTDDHWRRRQFTTQTKENV